MSSFIRIAGVDPDSFSRFADDDVSVIQMVCPGRLADRDNDPLNHVVRDHRFDLHHGHERDAVFRAPIDLSVVCLPVEPLDLTSGVAGPPRFL